METPQPPYQKDTKAQLIKLLEDAKGNAVAARAGACSFGITTRHHHLAGQIFAYGKAIKIIKMLNESLKEKGNN